MKNLALMCKSYIGDLSRLKILKESIDKFNADKLPFYICVPKVDFEIMRNEIVSGKEDYEIKFFTDEQVIALTNQPTNQPTIVPVWKKFNSNLVFSTIDKIIFF